MVWNTAPYIALTGIYVSIPYYIYMMQKELKERKQCSYKPSSVPIPSETIRAPVIYLVPESPLGSSTLPSAVARRQSDEPPSICGLHELTAPRWHSLTITRQLVVSYTTFSPLPDTKPRRMLKAPSLRNKFRAVVFFYRHLLSPIASIFGSGMPFAARTFLFHPHQGMPATSRSTAFELQR